MRLGDVWVPIHVSSSHGSSKETLDMMGRRQTDGRCGWCQTCSNEQRSSNLLNQFIYQLDSLSFASDVSHRRTARVMTRNIEGTRGNISFHSASVESVLRIRVGSFFSAWLSLQLCDRNLKTSHNNTALKLWVWQTHLNLFTLSPISHQKENSTAVAG